ncbi:hypothetical protein [Roseovarius pelagicus]|uniref:Uncharacterized protein n=1 Tax=Roseovarius pelagicus TaxID=2980108 RepID=A0ABY6D916_9RHOB|nr:hypothetical protein [Roseovarius pelagicus]UXX82632.1 hypothetical protein N7U68_16300 [Roseovarius pelagicus]
MRRRRRSTFAGNANPPGFDRPYDPTMARVRQLTSTVPGPHD